MAYLNLLGGHHLLHSASYEIIEVKHLNTSSLILT